MRRHRGRLFVKSTELIDVLSGKSSEIKLPEDQAKQIARLIGVRRGESCCTKMWRGLRKCFHYCTCCQCCESKHDDSVANIEVDVDEADMLVGTRLVVVLVTTLGDSVDVAISLVSLVLEV